MDDITGAVRSDWCPYKERRLGHRHTQRDDHIKTGRRCDLQAKERGLRRNYPADALIYFQNSISEATQSMVLCNSGPN